MSTMRSLDLVSWVFGNPNPSWHKPVLVDAANPERALTYKDIHVLVRQLIAGLSALGVSPGDTVLVNGFNDILYYPLYLAVIGSGARFTGANPSYTANELVHQFTLTDAKFVVVEPGLLQNTCQAAEAYGIPKESVVLLDGKEKDRSNTTYRNWSWLTTQGSQSWVRVSNPYETIATFAPTSGTTGMPKAAQISHAYHINQAELRIPSSPPPYEVKRLAALPPFHAFSTPIIPASIREQHITYVMTRLETGAFISNIKKYQISETFLPTPVVVTLPQHPLCTPENLDSLRQIWIAGAASKAENHTALYACLNRDAGAQINQVWGMTEAGWITAVTWKEEHLMDDSVGGVLDGFEAIVVDGADRPAMEGGSGEILIRSAYMFLGYQSNPTATKEAFVSLPNKYVPLTSKITTRPFSGTRSRTTPSFLPHPSPRAFNTSSPWLRTGDIGRVEAGKVFIVDRKKDLIKVRGWQVSSAEVECAIMTCPGVAGAAVVGMNTGTVDEYVKAFVVRQRSHLERIDGVTIKAWISNKVTKYKMPEEIVFVESIPKNSTGKVLRQQLKEMKNVILVPDSSVSDMSNGQPLIV